jgi:hypothetical protein
VKTLVELSHVVSSIVKEQSDLLSNITGYQQLIGKLIYLSHTRPDIAYSVHYLSQYMHSPTVGHLRIALRLLRYLKSSPRKGIMFSKGENLELSAYSDSDLGKCLETRKSVTGFCVFLVKNMISWKTKKYERRSVFIIHYSYKNTHNT